MQDRNARAEKSSTFDPDEPPTTPFAHTLDPRVRPTPPRSTKIRKVNAPLGASQKRVLEKPSAKLPMDDAPTLRPPPPTPVPTLPAPPRASSPPPLPPAAKRKVSSTSVKTPIEPIMKAMPVIIIPSDLPPPPAPQSEPPPSVEGTTTKTMPAITPVMRGSLPDTFLLGATTVPMPVVTATPLSSPPEEAVVTLSVPAPEPKRRRRRWPLRVAVLVILVGGELVLAHKTGKFDLPRDVGAARAMLAMSMRGHVDSAQASTAPPAPIASPVDDAPPDAPEPSTDDGAFPAAAIPPGMGALQTKGAQPGHRIFVDDRTMGQTPLTVLVKCGAVTVKLGSAGREQAIDVPCGGTIAVDDR